MPDFSRLSLRSAMASDVRPARLDGIRQEHRQDRGGRPRGGARCLGAAWLILSALFADAADLPQRMLSICVKVDRRRRALHARDRRRRPGLVAHPLAPRSAHEQQEIKEEVRQAEGDRMMKARFRSLQLGPLRKRMLNAVPRATMVVVNPTHYAVAMRYVRGEGRRRSCWPRASTRRAEDPRNRREHEYSRHRGQAAGARALRRGAGRQRDPAGILSRRRGNRSYDPEQAQIRAPRQRRINS